MDVEKYQRAWAVAVRAWSRDNCADVIVTMKLGEAMVWRYCTSRTHDSKEGAR